MLGRRLEPPGAGRQVHTCGASVVRIGASNDQPTGLERRHERHGRLVLCGSSADTDGDPAVRQGDNRELTLKDGLAAKGSDNFPAMDRARARYERKKG